MEYNDNFEVKGWLSKVHTGKSLAVSVGEGKQRKFLGFVRKTTLERCLNGEVDGVPIKIQKAK